MVSLCLPSDALLQHLPSYLGFFYLGRGVSPLGPPAPTQPPLLRRGVAPPGRRPWPPMWGSSSRLLLHCRSLALSAAAPDLGRWVAPFGRCSWPRMWGSSSWPPPLWHGVLLASASDLRHGVAPLSHACALSQPPMLQHKRLFPTWFLPLLEYCV